MPRIARKTILEKFGDMIADGRPIIGGGAGTGLSAKCAEAGGIDLIIIYNSGRFRMAGRGSMSGMMPYGDANQIVMDMAREVLPVARETAVLAGVCGTDPFRLMPNFLKDVERHEPAHIDVRRERHQHAGIDVLRRRGHRVGRAADDRLLADRDAVADLDRRLLVVERSDVRVGDDLGVARLSQQ